MSPAVGYSVYLTRPVWVRLFAISNVIERCSPVCFISIPVIVNIVMPGQPNKKRKPSRSQASRLLTLAECFRISSELLIGRKCRKAMQLKRRDHCLFWFIIMTAWVSLVNFVT